MATRSTGFGILASTSFRRRWTLPLSARPRRCAREFLCSISSTVFGPRTSYEGGHLSDEQSKGVRMTI